MLRKGLRFARDAAIVSLVAVALVALVEVGLRLYVGPPAFAFDPERITKLVPNLSKIYLRSVDGGPRAIRWRTNADGFRGPPLMERPDVRVMVYGDSNVHARFSSQEDTFTGRLQALVDPSIEGRVEVINAGVVGYGPDQNLIRLPHDFERYEPDAVVFHVFVENDFGDIVRNRLFTIDARETLVRTRHAVTPDARMPTGIWSRPLGEGLSNSMISIFAESFFRGRARATDRSPELDHDPQKFVDSRLRQHAREFAVYRDDAPRKYSVFSDHYEADIAFDPKSESARTKRALLAAVLREASRICADEGVPFLVVIQPTSRDLTTNLRNHHEALADVPGYDRRRLDRWAQEICEEAQIDFVNLFEVFEATGSPARLYFPDPDPHWNEAGQDVAARAVAPRLRQALR